MSDTNQEFKKYDGTARWRVKEVFKSPTSVLVEINVANYITEGEDWPKVGQELKVVKDE